MNLLLISEILENPTPPAFGGEFQVHIDKKRNPRARRASLTAWSLLAWGFELICPEVQSVQDIPDNMADNKNICLQQEEQGICPCAETAGWGRDEPPVSAGHRDSYISERIAVTGSSTGSYLTLSSVSGSEPYLCQQHAATLHSGLPAVRFGAQGKPEFADCVLQFSLAHSGNFAVALLSALPCGVDIERVREDVAGRLYYRVLSEEERRMGLDFFECWTRKECIGKLSGLGVGAHPSNINTLDARWAGRFHNERFTDALTGDTYVLNALCEEDSPLQILRLPQ